MFVKRAQNGQPAWPILVNYGIIIKLLGLSMWHINQGHHIYFISMLRLSTSCLKKISVPSIFVQKFVHGDIGCALWTLALCVCARARMWQLPPKGMLLCSLGCH